MSPLLPLFVMVITGNKGHPEKNNASRENTPERFQRSASFDAVPRRIQDT